MNGMKLRVHGHRLLEMTACGVEVTGSSGDHPGMVVHFWIGGVLRECPFHRINGARLIAVFEIDPRKNIGLQHIASEFVLFRKAQCSDRMAVVVGEKLRHLHMIVDAACEMGRVQFVHLHIITFGL